LQNADGGWPTFCRGWGALPFDRSGTDLTAHAMRALGTWEELIPDDRIGEAVRRGFHYLAERQRPDGSWVPLWFGNQHRQGEKNPVYGTARVLLAYRDFGRIDTPPAQRGLAWLAANALSDGGWGSDPQAEAPHVSSIEETAVAVEALLADPEAPQRDPVLEAGLRRLVAAVGEGGHRETAPIGLYFARLWYYEKLYPQMFTVSALGQAVARLCPGSSTQPARANRGNPDSAG
jgi:squalene-hopene/tetraprenyl-beta-curcumene cyclase